ncbi:MAG: pentapeptide repeat-containing protein [Sphingomonadales bacterium]
MKTFIYEIPSEWLGEVETGEIEAEDENDAQRQLRVKFLLPRLPEGTVIRDKEAIHDAEQAVKSGRLRHLLSVLTNHYKWRRGEPDGERADLRGLNLSNLVLAGTDFVDADLSGANLSGCDLTDADFRRANLYNASMRGAKLSGANLSHANLSDADLRYAVVTGANLDGSDLWRANLAGCVIAPKILHSALGCVTSIKDK